MVTFPKNGSGAGVVPLVQPAKPTVNRTTSKAVNVFIRSTNPRFNHVLLYGFFMFRSDNEKTAWFFARRTSLPAWLETSLTIKTGE